jgi:deoxyadenosine/deoxycytidine kinase
MSNSKYLVYVEGNIAAGKSTFINMLKGELNESSECFLEPLEKWTNLRGVNLLEDMYASPKSKSFNLQTYIQLTMAEIQMNKQTKPIKITERSLMSERFVFIENLLENDLIGTVELSILDEWYQFLSKQFNKVNEIIYLQTTPETSYQRLRLRNRSEESSVSLDYITQIHNLYEKWLVLDPEHSLEGTKIRIINQNLALHELIPIYNNIVVELKQKL